MYIWIWKMKQPENFLASLQLLYTVVWAWDIESTQKINASFQNIAQTENKMSVV